MTGQVYALASGKGGVGKTTTAVNLGVTLRSAGHSVALVDADLGMANLATVLDIDHKTTLHDVLAGDAMIEEALCEEATGFAVLPGTRELSGFAAADPDRLDTVLGTLAESYEYVLVDTGGALSYEDTLPLGMVDDILLVTTPDAAAIGDTRKTKELADLVGGHVQGVIVNRAIDSIDPESVANELETALLATIPQDRNVAESTLAGRPLKAYSSDSPAARAFDQLAASITNESADNAAVSDQAIAEEHGEDTTTPTKKAAGERSGTAPSESGGSVPSTRTVKPGSAIADESPSDAKGTRSESSTKPETDDMVEAPEASEYEETGPRKGEDGEQAARVSDDDDNETKIKSDSLLSWLSRLFD